MGSREDKQVIKQWAIGSKDNKILVFGHFESGSGRNFHLPPPPQIIFYHPLTLDRDIPQHPLGTRCGETASVTLLTHDPRTCQGLASGLSGLQFLRRLLHQIQEVWKCLESASATCKSPGSTFLFIIKFHHDVDHQNGIFYINVWRANYSENGSFWRNNQICCTKYWFLVFCTKTVNRGWFSK